MISSHRSPEDDKVPSAPDRHPAEPGDVTRLLRRLRNGDGEAQADLFRLVYSDLKRLAQSQISEMTFRGDLEGTSLANAACERVLRRGTIDAQDRRRFFFLLARAIHDVLVEEVRHDHAECRGGRARRVPMVEIADGRGERRVELLAVCEAIELLGKVDRDAADIVQLRFHAGRTLEESAELLGRSLATVRKDWEFAKAWLARELAGKGSAS